MTKLEEEIRRQIMDCSNRIHSPDGCDEELYICSGDYTQLSKLIAEVAKKYINSALEHCAILTNKQYTTTDIWPRIKDKWLKENGIIE